MLTAVLDIPFYEQMQRAWPRAVASLHEAFAAAGTLAPMFEHRRTRAFRLPDSSVPRLREALVALADLRSALRLLDLPDHLCVVFDSHGSSEERIAAEAEELFQRLETDAAARGSDPAGPLWRRAVVVHASAAAVVRRAAPLAGEGEFLALELGGRKAATPGPAPRPATSGAVGFWRPHTVNRLVDAAFSALEEGRRAALMVSGRDGVGKSRSVIDAARLVVGETWAASIVTVYSVYSRRSAVHPFLNSLRTDLLEAVPSFLCPWELRVWRTHEALIRALLPRGRCPPEQEAPGHLLCPDRLGVDFPNAYRLYLLAYVRAMAERSVPALVLFEDIHTYHPEALRFTRSLVLDLLRLPSFLPVLTCRDDHDACGLLGADVIAVPVPPLSLSEIRAAAASLYGGVRPREKAARRLKSLSGGRPAALRHYLRHLQRSGKIVPREGAWAWVTGVPADLPPDPAAAAWEEIEALAPKGRELLYLCSLAGAILGAEGVLELDGTLESRENESSVQAERPRSDRKALEELAEAGLIRSAGVPAFLHPELRERLAAALGARADLARSAFADRLVEAWRSGDERSLVLVFSALRGSRLEIALEVLERIITKKLDELNVRGCRFFLDPAKLRMPPDASPELRRRHERIVAFGELRSQLLLGNWRHAEQTMDRVSNLLIPDGRLTEQAQRALEQARFHLVKADAPAAVKAAKTAVILYHEAGDERGERRAEAELGASLLAEGRLEEALEYLGFVMRSAGGDLFPRIRSAALSAIAAYLLGDASESVRLAEVGLGLASSGGRREWQAVLMFLRIRQRFDFGRLDEAVAALEELLCFARVYGMERSRNVALAWMGRTLVYAGSSAEGLRLLETLSDTPEVRFFRAEGLFFGERVPDALRLLEAPDGLRRRQAMHPGERVSWESGFSSVEERCAALRREGGTLHRLMRGFRAYLVALDGRPEQAMRELYRITREERVWDLDPYLPLYNYWYATTLPEESREGSDHKLTVLNRAVKHLQGRASRVENARDRSLLMSGNYWNARLLQEARARRLV